MLKSKRRMLVILHDEKQKHIENPLNDAGKSNKTSFRPVITVHPSLEYCTHVYFPFAGFIPRIRHEAAAGSLVALGRVPQYRFQWVARSHSPGCEPSLPFLFPA